MRWAYFRERVPQIFTVQSNYDKLHAFLFLGFPPSFPVCGLGMWLKWQFGAFDVMKQARGKPALSCQWNGSLELQPTDTILTTTQHYWREQCMPSIHACLALGLISSNVHSISASGRCSNNWKTLQLYNSLYWFCSVLQGCDVLLDRHYYYDLASTNSMVLETSWNQNIHHVPRLFVFGPSSTHTPHH